MKKFKRIYKNLDRNRKEIAEKLCKKAAFMNVTLDDMQDQIVEEGYIRTGINGNGFEVTMEHPVLKSYNTMVKNYNTVIKQMIDLMPDGASEADELLEFVRGDKR